MSRRKVTINNIWEDVRKELNIPRGPFEKRIRQLFGIIDTLSEKQKQGYRYKRVWREGYTVRKHDVAGHYTHVLVKK